MHSSVQLEVCKEQVQWAQSEKRTFLRQRIEIRLATLYLETRDYTAAITLIGKLLTEVTAAPANAPTLFGPSSFFVCLGLYGLQC